MPEELLITILKVASGLCWSITYVLIIRKGFTDKTYGMPFIALAANFSWEFIFSVMHPHSPLQHGIDIVWLGLDAIIVFQFLKWGIKEFSHLTKVQFYTQFLITIATCFGLILFTTYQFEPDKLTGAYAAFGQNLLMSILFIQFLHQRKGLSGQSMGIAVFKMLGTLAASLIFGFTNKAVIYHTPIMYFLFGLYCYYDSFYWFFDARTIVARAYRQLAFTHPAAVCRDTGISCGPVCAGQRNPHRRFRRGTNYGRGLVHLAGDNDPQLSPDGGNMDLSDHQR